MFLVFTPSLFCTSLYARHRRPLSEYIPRAPHVTTLQVQPYTLAEMQHCVMHYAASGVFSYPLVDRQFVGEISLATNRMPLEIRKHCTILSIE